MRTLGIFSCLTLLVCVGLMNTAARAGDTSPVAASATIEAPLDQVWDAFTTSAGLESWLAPHAEIELKLGGRMRTHYSKDGVLGDENTIINEIQSFQPQRMLSIRVVKPPETFPFKQAVMSMWTVLLFEPLSPRQTRLTATGMGFTDDEESQQIRKHFDAGNKYTLTKLQEYFSAADKSHGEAEDDGEIVRRLMHEADAPSDASSKNADDVLDVLHKLVGGEWLVENKRPDGSVFRARVVAELGPDSQSVMMRGWLGDDAKLSPHAATQVWRAPVSMGGGIHFQSINERGDIARGNILAVAKDKIAWDWNVTALDGGSQHYRVEMTLQDADHYRFVLHHFEEDGTLKELVNILYTRALQGSQQSN